MVRFLIVIICMAVVSIPAPVIADEDTDQESEVLSLYKGYRASLEVGDNEAALKLAESVYVLTPSIYSKISKNYATATFNLAQMNDLLKNRKEAAKFYQEYIDTLDQLKVPKDVDYLSKLELLSEAYLKAYKFDKAIIYGRKALSYAKKLKVPTDLLAKYELMLGIYYYRSADKGYFARRHINNAFELLSETYGEHHIKMAQVIFWQAKMDLGLKKNFKAARQFEKALAIFNAELPVGDKRILQTHAFLVNAYELLGDKNKSTEHCIAVATERPTDFDREIEPLYKVATKLPKGPAYRYKPGYILAEFTIDEIGQVRDIKTLEGERIGLFEKYVHKALSQFRYAPSIKDGKRVRTEGVRYKVSFYVERK